jgi:hypothetical protein
LTASSHDWQSLCIRSRRLVLAFSSAEHSIRFKMESTTDKDCCEDVEWSSFGGSKENGLSDFEKNLVADLSASTNLGVKSGGTPGISGKSG